MNSNLHVRLAAKDGWREAGDEPEFADELSQQRLTAPLRRAIMRSRQWLLAEQHSDGHWVGELEGDTILESEYILLLAYLGREGSDLAKKAAEHLVAQQLESGGWALYPGGTPDVSASVKAYFALKLTGHDPSDEYMQRAREAILAAGGADCVNSFTRFYLALLGQISYDVCPEVPPEMVLVPGWMPLNIYRMSAWSRTIVIPLSIMSAYRPVREVEASRGIRELFLRRPEEWPPLRCPGREAPRGLLSWDRFFRLVDRGLKLCRSHRLLPLRARALRVAERWMLERFEGSDGLGAIFPPIIWSIVALRCRGYADDSPEMQYNLRHLESLIIEEDETARLEPCKSPVWDTSISVRALAESGVGPDHPAMQEAVRWLLSKESRRKGDYARTVRAEPGGWYFEHANEFYPDLDDTAMVLLAIRTQFGGGPKSDVLPPGLRVFAHRTADSMAAAREQTAMLDRMTAAAERALAWTLAMQNRDGGWGAFDRDNDCRLLCHVPFADHNAMIDPSTPDLTARVLEALGAWGVTIGHAAVEGAVRCLRNIHEADGSWYGRWGVNYIYGTWQAIVGLRAVGVPPDDPAIVAGVNWLIAHQQASGGWGESPDSYAEVSRRGQGPVTASQTAWALLALLAAGEEQHSAVARGVRFLLDEQQADGTWEESEFTGTGFPQVFYLRYHMYPIYFPLLALSQYAVAAGGVDQTGEQVPLKLVDAAVSAAEAC